MARPQYPEAALLKAKEVAFKGIDEEKLHFFAFSIGDMPETILFKFDFWARLFYPRYFQSRSADFHYDMMRYMIAVYCGKPLDTSGPHDKSNYLNLGFRGCAKTTYTKLFLTYALLCDVTMHRKYLKVLTKNQANAKQIVTDVYNMMVEVQELYGNYFIKDDAKKLRS